MGIKQKFKMADSKKTEFFKIANSQKFFVKISWIGHWVSWIDWCERHSCSSTYMVVRLSEVSDKKQPKTQKMHFCQFLSLRQTVSQPYRLNHINVLCINQSYWPKDQSMKFSQKKIVNWRFWKTHFFWVGNFEILFSKKIKKIWLHPHENQSKLLGYQGWV